MIKCGACGKFLSTTEKARCCKCNIAFHKACVAIPSTASVKDDWICPGCKIKVPRVDNTLTPVKGMAADNHAPASPARPDDTAHNTTEELKLDFALEIRSFRNELKAIRGEVRECRLEVSEIKAALNSFDVKITEVENRVSALEAKYELLVPPNMNLIEETILDLKSQLNDREQELLANDIELTGVPEQSGEILPNLVMVLSSKLGVSLEERDVVHVERVGSVRRNRVEGKDGDLGAKRPRVIAIRLARRATRDQLLRAARVRRNLNTKDINVPGKPNNVYINERLSRHFRQLFYLARQAAKKFSWRYVWTRDGQVLARKEDGNRAVLIRTEKDVA